MSNNRNVESKETKTPKAWIFFVVLALLFLLFSFTIGTNYGTIVNVLTVVVGFLFLIVAVCFYIKKWTFKDFFFGTDEEDRERAKKKAAKKQKPDVVSDSSFEADEEPYAEEGLAEQPDEDFESEKPLEEANCEKNESNIEESPRNESSPKVWNGYDIGDVHVMAPVSCIGNYIGAVADAIKKGKVELAHGLILDDSNVVKLSLNEMIKFGYKAPSGYKVDAKHDTLVALPGNMHYVGKGQYEVAVPNGFVLIDKGEYAGEMIPDSVELIKGL